MDLEFRLASGPEGLAGLRDAWDGLAARHPSVTPFQCAAWYDAYLSALSRDPASVHFASAWRGDALAAVWPLRHVSQSLLGLSVDAIRFPAHAHLAVTDCLFDPDENPSRLLEGLARFLNTHPGRDWDVMYFGGIPGGSDTGRLFDACRSTHARSVLKRAAYRIRIPPDPGRILDHMPGRLRRNMQRLERKATRQGRVELTWRATPDGLSDALEQFLDVEADNWKGRAGSAINQQPCLREFYARLVRARWPVGGCRIHLLTLDDQPVAGHFALYAHRTLHLLKIGYRQAHSGIGPGNVLLTRVLRELAAGGGIDTVDLVTAPAWAEKWKTHAHPVYDHYYFNDTLLGQAGLQFKRVKSRLRRLTGRIPVIEDAREPSDP